MEHEPGVHPDPCCCIGLLGATGTGVPMDLVRSSPLQRWKTLSMRRSGTSQIRATSQ